MQNLILVSVLLVDRLTNDLNELFIDLMKLTFHNSGTNIRVGLK